ncbi:MAG: hypothetical protein KDD63_01400 [Bacteroidetes bacterium]|nr:hypothetical protein [Bacteroidota bacterium]
MTKNETIILSGYQDDLEKVDKRVKESDLGESYLVSRKNLDGDIATWIAALSIAAHSIPLVLSSLRKAVQTKAITRLKIGDIEIENPDSAMLQQIIDSYVEANDLRLVGDKKKKIVFVSANSSGIDPNLMGKEIREIKEGLRRSGKRDSLDIIISPANQPKDFTRVILDENPYILHFSGEGSSQGIILEDIPKNPQILTGDALGSLFKLFRESVHCVVLNAPFSESQAREIVKYIPFVVGITDRVPEESKLAFAVGFYDGIGAGRDLDFSFEFGKANIQLNGLEGSGSFILVKNK